MINEWFPIRSRRIVLRCLRDTDIGAFPEFRLGAFLLSVDSKHKNHADSIALEVPRSTKFRYRRHDHFEFRLYAANAHRARLERIEAMLRELPQSAALTGTDIAFGDNWALHGIEDLHPFGSLGLDQLDEEVAHWRDVSRFRIRLASPWRIVPSVEANNRRKQPVITDPALVDSALLGRVLTQSLITLKFQMGAHEWRVPELPLRIVDKSLWHVGSPTSPGGKHPNVFEEGLFGDCTVEWTKPPTDDQWRHLLLLVRFGVGQSRAFGLGRMQLERNDRMPNASDGSPEGLANLCERLIPNLPEFESLPRDSARDAVIRLHDAGWHPCLSMRLPAAYQTAIGIAAPEARLSALAGTCGISDLLDRIPEERRDTLRRALRYAALARACRRHRLRVVVCEGSLLLLSQSRARNDRTLASIRQSLLVEGVDPNDHAVSEMDDPLDFSWCGHHFVGGLALPGSRTQRMFAVDQRIGSEESTSQAA